MQHTKAAEVIFIVDYIGKGYLSTGNSEKGVSEHTVKGKFCSPLFTHRYTVDRQAPPPLGGFLTQSMPLLRNTKFNGLLWRNI